MFGERRDGQDDVGDPPAPRDGEQDRPERRRTGSRSARGRGSGRRRRRARGRPARRASSAGPGAARRPTGPPTMASTQEHGPDDAPPGSAPNSDDARRRTGSAGARGGVADPQAGCWPGCCRVAGHERPRVVGVDRQVRVAAAGHDDLVDQAGRDERRGRPSSRTDSPNGRHRTTAVRKPARPVVRIRDRCVGPRSQAAREHGPAPASARRVARRRPATAPAGW